MKHIVPYGINSFRELREENGYYIDKTSFLNELEGYKVPVYLRPRRFGKSLFCSMINSYYDINQKGDYDHLFGDLYVGKNPTPLKNSFMVLHLDFSRITPSTNLEELKQSFYHYIRITLEEFTLRYDSFFPKEILFLKNHNIADMLNTLCNAIKKFNTPPLYIIIDEYDNFTNYLITTDNDGLYEEVTIKGDFFKSFFKTIKSAITDRSIGKVFITGILPITLDDITSSFNISELITLEPQFHSLVGFTQEEINNYVSLIFDEYQFDKSNIPQTLSYLKDYYNGYRFTSEKDDTVYNATIVTYFFKLFIRKGGTIPKNSMDPNLKTDVSWIERLAQGKENGIEQIERIMLDNNSLYSLSMLTSSFNKNTFFNKEFFPIALFYLGHLSIYDDFELTIPNQSTKLIMAEFYNSLADIKKADHYYGKIFQEFSKDLDLPKMFDGYWKSYISQINAQVFDKMNENFFRVTFFELCSRYLTASFTFGIEVGYPSGRSDWEMLGKYHTIYKNKKWLVEFKYFNKTDAKQKKIMALKEPRKKEIKQVNEYAHDILTQFPEYDMKKYVIYICSNDDFKCFEVK